MVMEWMFVRRFATHRERVTSKGSTVVLKTASLPLVQELLMVSPPGLCVSTTSRSSRGRRRRGVAIMALHCGDLAIEDVAFAVSEDVLTTIPNRKYRNWLRCVGIKALFGCFSYQAACRGNCSHRDIAVCALNADYIVLSPELSATSSSKRVAWASEPWMSTSQDAPPPPSCWWLIGAGFKS